MRACQNLPTPKQIAGIYDYVDLSQLLNMFEVSEYFVEQFWNISGACSAALKQYGFGWYVAWRLENLGKTSESQRKTLDNHQKVIRPPWTIMRRP